MDIHYVLWEHLVLTCPRAWPCFVLTQVFFLPLDSIAGGEVFIQCLFQWLLDSIWPTCVHSLPSYTIILYILHLNNLVKNSLSSCWIINTAEKIRITTSLCPHSHPCGPYLVEVVTYNAWVRFEIMLKGVQRNHCKRDLRALITYCSWCSRLFSLKHPERPEFDNGGPRRGEVMVDENQSWFPRSLGTVAASSSQSPVYLFIHSSHFTFPFVLLSFNSI